MGKRVVEPIEVYAGWHGFVELRRCKDGNLMLGKELLVDGDELYYLGDSDKKRTNRGYWSGMNGWFTEYYGWVQKGTFRNGKTRLIFTDGKRDLDPDEFIFWVKRIPEKKKASKSTVITSN